LVKPDCLTILKTSAKTINSVVKPNRVFSVVLKFVAPLMKVTITGINAVTNTTSTTTPVMSIAPFSEPNILAKRFFILKILKYSYYINFVINSGVVTIIIN